MKPAGIGSTFRIRTNESAKTESLRSREHEAPTVGAAIVEGGVRFRVWAPRPDRVELVIESGPGIPTGCAPRSFMMTPEGEGYLTTFVEGAAAGTRYRYRLDDAGPYPDPASRRQPEGPHGPSEVVDPRSFAWTDAGWHGLTLPGQVIYELHVGTFTPAGTFASAVSELPRLKELGITCLELMPVAEFPGQFGWGYDGVALFAPFHHYGSPDDLRRLVDAAHGLGLGVILDVVYNHLGPDGAYHKLYAEAYYNGGREKTDWGEALNFDGPGCGPARDFFAANAAMWIDEYHFDGLRLDATQAIRDDSEDPFLTLLARRCRAAARRQGRSIVLIAEDESQDCIRTKPVGQGGYGLDAQWNDDYHHAAVVALTGRSEAYYQDYRGTPQELISATKWGFLFQGQHFGFTGKPRGTPTFGLPGAAFVTYLENHDQVSNSPRGDRLRLLTSPGRYKAMAAAWLLAPGTPLFFQGQEFGATTPFYYFADHAEELARLVHKGRYEFLCQFRSVASPEFVDFIPDPGARDTFLGSKLDPAERERNGHIVAFHRDLLELRRTDAVFATQDAGRIQGAVLGEECFLLRYFGEGSDCRLVIVNLGRDLFPNPTSEPMLAPPPGTRWAIQWVSEHPKYGGCGVPPLETMTQWRLPGHCAVVLRPSPPERA